MLANGFQIAASVSVCVVTGLACGFVGWAVGFYGGWGQARAWFERQLLSGSYRVGRVNYNISGASLEPETSPAWHADETEPMVRGDIDAATRIKADLPG